MARRVFNAVVLAIGAVALALILRELGWSRVVTAIVDTGWGFAVIAAIDLASVFCDAAGIYVFIRPNASIGYWRVFVAQASGLAINRLTPGNSLGEPTKITMLAGHVPAAVAVSGVVMFNLVTYYIAFAAIALGVPVTLLLLDLPARVEVAVWIATGLLVGFAMAAAIVVRRGAAVTLVSALARVRLISATRAAAWSAKVAEIDAHVRVLGDLRSSGPGIAAVFASRCLNWAGTIAVLHVIGLPLTAPLVVAMMSVGLVITWLGNVIPLGLAIADGGNYVLYGLLGASPEAGLVFTMVNRVRTVLLAAMGLSIMLVASLLGRRVAPR